MRLSRCVGMLLIVLLSSSPVHAATTLSPHQLADQAEKQLNSDMGAAAATARQLLDQLDRTPDPALRLRAQLILVRARFGLGDYAKTVSLAEQGMMLAKAQDDQAHYLRFMLYKGNGLEYQGDLDQAARLYDEAVDESAKQKLEKIHPLALENRGALRSYQGDYAKALDDIQRAITEYQSSGQPDREYNAYTTLSNLYSHMGEYAQAITYLDRAEEYFANQGDQSEMAVIEYNKAVALRHQNKYAAAADSYLKSRKLSEAVGDVPGIAYAELGAGSVLFSEGEVNKALPHLQNALKRFEALGDIEESAQVKLVLGRTHLALHHYDRAIDLLKQCMATYKASGTRSKVAEIYQHLAVAYAEQGDYHQAYELFRQFKIADDDLRNADKEKQLNALRVQFHSAQKDRENTLLRKENRIKALELQQRQRQLVLQYSVLALGIVVLLLLGYLAYRKIREARRMELLANMDALTAVPNRRNILHRLDTAYAAAQPEGELAVIMFDIDHFKQLNDQYGHAAGDQALQQVAAAVQEQLRDQDSVGRIGGEEFLVVLPGATLATGLSVAERLRRTVEALSIPGLDDESRLTISLGVAGLGKDDSDSAALMARADALLYEAKAAGRNCVRPAQAR